MRVLCFSANPEFTEELRLGDELQEIESVLRWGKILGNTEFQFIPEVRKSDLERYLYTETPDVVHFSCHGGKEMLQLSDDDNQRDDVEATAIAMC